jgi:hypothetical protein
MAHTAFAVGLYLSALALNHEFIELIITS